MNALPPATPSPSILVVADDRALRSQVAELLRAEGFRVSAVASQAPVIAVVDARAGFDAAIVDVVPPDGAALAVVRHLLGTSELPVLLLSAPTSSIFAADSLPPGSITQLVKPIEPLQLLAIVRSVIANHRERRSLRAQNEQLVRAVGQARDVNVVVGILMERFRLDRGAAFEALRRQARSRRVSVADFAYSLMEAEERLQAFAALANTAADARKPVG